MFGYVLPSQARLTEEDRARFSAVYCGLCRTLGRRYGGAAQMILNYDFAFLALLLAEPEEGERAHRRCLPHPVKGRDYYVESEALDLAADHSVILAWWQVQDAIADHTPVQAAKYRAVSAALAPAYHRAKTLRPAFDQAVARQLEELHALERDNCPSMDRAADTFARLLQSAAGEVAHPVKRRVLEQLLYHLGRWIYLIDAADDLAEDFASGGYNPLIGRFALAEGRLTQEARHELVLSLDNSIRLMAAAYELWDFGVWGPIIQATVYEGLFSVGRAVLEGTFHAGGRKRKSVGRDEEQL